MREQVRELLDAQDSIQNRIQQVQASMTEASHILADSDRQAQQLQVQQVEQTATLGMSIKPSRSCI